ncbi:hypothetical protein ACFOG8_14150 [Xanthomonas fragariae]
MGTYSARSSDAQDHPGWQPTDPTMSPRDRRSVRNQNISMNYAFKQTKSV